MISEGNRRQGHPILVNAGSIQKLQRIPFLEKTFPEEWIQQLIQDQPHMLPVDEIESNFGPLIPIGKETPTAAGYIDNLFISPEGYLTIVETKLWRNPEARREVVGQIIDYAKELSKWTFTELNNAVIAYNRRYKNNDNGVLETIREYETVDESEESYFIDNVSRNLKRGRFLLLIVGDGIRESVEEMVEYLSKSPQLYFTLSLIELQVYKMENSSDSLLIIPQIITRTKEITRAIIRVEHSASENVQVSIETDIGMEPSKNEANVPARSLIKADDFFEQLLTNSDDTYVAFAKQIISDAEERGYIVEWGQGSFVVKLPDPSGSGQKITLFIVDRKMMVYIGYSVKQLERLGIPIEISYDFAANTAALFEDFRVNPERKYSWSRYQNMKELRPVYSQFLSCVDAFAQKIRNAVEKED